MAARKRRGSARRRLALEGLESRQLLTIDFQVLDPWAFVPPFEMGDPGAGSAETDGPISDFSDSTGSSEARTLIQTLPADGAELQDAPDALVVTFPTSDARDFGDNLPIQLVRVGSDGGLSPLFDPNNPPIISFDDSGTVATIPLDQSLAPGRYRIVLAGGTTVSLVLGSGLWDGMADQDLGEFQVAEQGPSLEDAADLGAVGPNVVSVPGFLDLASKHNPVDIYKFTLTTDHFWRLGVQLDASRIGSQLGAALTLFDASGRVIAVRDAGSGRADFPDDPYLFQGLAPGVYYLGVSGAGNLPDGAGPNLGYPGASHGREGGNYLLRVVADWADQPTIVSGFRLSWADTLSTSPTGLTLSFSGPIDVQSIVAPSGHASLVAVDPTGGTWTLTALSYNESRCQLSLVFDSPLPAGRYSLLMATPGGLTDLAGLRVVAPGLSSGELARWTVAPQAGRTAAGDLGVLWPSMDQGFSAAVTLGPGQLSTWRVVVTRPGTYEISTHASAGSWALSRVGQDGLVRLDDGAGSLPDARKMTLEPGVYLFTIANRGRASGDVSWRLRPVNVLGESLLDNGVGQSAALNLRLINPLSSGPGAGSPPGLATVSPGGEQPGPGVLSPTGPDAVISLATPSTSAPAVTASVVPTNLLVGVSSGLLGRPATQSATTPDGSQVAAAPSIASTDPTVRSFIRLEAESRGDEAVPQPPTPPQLGEPEAVLAANDQPAAEVVEKPVDRAGADALALLRADDFVQLASRLERWILGRTANAPETPAPVQDDLLASLLGDEIDGHGGRIGGLEGSEEGRIERAELGVPLSMVVAAAAAYRLRQLAKGWWRRSWRKGGLAMSSDQKSSVWPVPHFWSARPVSGVRGKAMR